jgi:AcrR family transcriptional regulator
MSASLIVARMDMPQDARQVRSRNALHGALLDLLQDNAFEQITIREISARAGTGYATFFRHYPTKEALLGDVAAEEICTLMTMTASMMTGPDRFGSILDLCNYVDAHRKLWSALLVGGAAGIVREEMMRQANTLGDERQCPDWLPPELARRVGVSSAIDVLVWWLEQKERHSPQQVAVILDRLVIGPIMDKLVAGPDVAPVR